MSISPMVVIGEGDLAGLTPNEIQAEAGTVPDISKAVSFGKSLLLSRLF